MDTEGGDTPYRKPAKPPCDCKTVDERRLARFAFALESGAWASTVAGGLAWATSAASGPMQMALFAIDAGFVLTLIVAASVLAETR